jgi:actin-related protein
MFVTIPPPLHPFSSFFPNYFFPFKVAQAAEAPFDTCVSRKKYSLQSIILDSVLEMNPDQHRQMLSNITVTGGGAASPGFCLHLEQELLLRLQGCGGNPVYILNRDQLSEDRRCAVWEAAAELASSANRSNAFVSNYEFQRLHPALLAKIRMDGLNFLPV